ncbi:MAG: hypothetical protein HN919_10895 [Verrucomicrobia bacterium]|jgi:hypothetical protein|nr:hypothetical protein [Verrucomicrobiota bacterium]MBT7066801.1 hypothetical protein [Verrucomicrobiota bacterium]MBT7701460.1 hypothetical protein [Verrucomicrobiota bacterium]
MHTRRSALCLLLALTLSAAGSAQETHLLVLPHVQADRVARRVTIAAEATGIGEHDTAEFFLIAPHSGNDYEALARSLATAGDIDRCLRFIGLTPGLGIDVAAYRFWPRGERVTIWFKAAGSNTAPLRAESLILDDRTGQPLPPDGLVYVQAPTNGVTPGDSPSAHPVDADSRGAIAANYNEAFTLFDVPRAAPQGTVYAQQTVNPAHILPAGQRLDIIIEPELPAGRKRVRRLDLAITSAAVATQSLARLQFALAPPGDTAGRDALGMNALLRQITTLCRERVDPFVTLRVHEDVQIGALKAFCLILASIETDRGIRLEPPAAGHLYYKAYIPDNALRDRETRIMQPVELTFTCAAGGAITVTLLDIQEHWHADQVKPTLTFSTHTVDSPVALKDQLGALGDDLPILLVFVPGDLTHGELMRWMAPILTSHPTVHVFTPVTQP